MANEWIKLSSGEDAIRLFCFPFSGGTAQVYRPLARLLPNGICVFAYELPGRGRRFNDPAFENIPDMVSDAMKGLMPLLSNSNFAFFGYSLGGLLAYEAAHELSRKELNLPRHLFVAASRAPHLSRREDETSYYDLPDEKFISKLKEMGGTPQEVLDNQEILELMLPVIRKDFKAYEAYKNANEKPLNCPITAFGGEFDRLVLPSDVQEWSKHTAKLFLKHIYEGDHFFIQSYAEKMAGVITRALAMQRPW